MRRMKFIAAFCLLILFKSCSPSPSPAQSTCQTASGAACSSSIGLNGSPVQAIVITIPPMISVGTIVQATANYKLADGSINIKVPCLWSSGNVAVFTVGSTGLVSGLTAGSATLTCKPIGPNNIGISGTTTVSVGVAPVITLPTCVTAPCPLPTQTQNVSVGTSLSPAFAASGGASPYTWTVSVGSLPTGLSLGNFGCGPGASVGCNITGIPTGTGTSTFTIHVADANSVTATLQVTLLVNPAPGPPAQYAARTDTCETGASSDPGKVQCNGSATGALGSAMSYLGRLAILGFAPSAPAPYNLAPTPQGTPLPDTVPVMGPSGTPSGTCSTTPQPGSTGFNQYLCGSLSAAPYSLGLSFVDPDFNSTIYRVTDYSMSKSTNYNCGGGNGFGTSFTLGNDGNSHYWDKDSTKFIVTNTGSANAIFQWDPSGHLATLSAVCGANFPGNYAFSFVNDHIIWSLVDDQESSVAGVLTGGGTYGGTFVTWPAGETIKQSGLNCGVSTVFAVGATLMQIDKLTAGTHDCGTAWTGQTSGAVFTPTASSAGLATAFAYVNMLYKGILCDGAGDGVQATCPSSATTTPSTWVMEWQPFTNFNDVKNQVGTVLGTPFFPGETGGVSNGMPIGYHANYQGVRVPSYDDTSFTILFGDNGQGGHPDPTPNSCPNSPGGTCTGPVWEVNYTVGSGTSTIDTMTMTVVSGWAPNGHLTQGQYKSIQGTITGTFTVGETLTQGTSGAKTQLLSRTWTGHANNVIVGTVVGSPDNSHTWTGGSSGATIAPSPVNLPTDVPFTDFDTMHEASNSANAAYATGGGVQQSNGTVSNWQTCTPTCGSTAVTFSEIGQWDAGQYTVFAGLTGGAAYANSPQPYFWANAIPFQITTGTGKNGLSFVIQDSSTACNSGCAQGMAQQGEWAVASGGSGNVGSYVRFYWTIGSLEVNSCISGSCKGHEAKGYVGNYTAKVYTAHNWSNPSLPCNVSPGTPCPSGQETPLFPQSIPGDQHGAYLNSGTLDNTPVGLFTTNVAGFGQTGVGARSVSPDSQAYSREMDMGENFIYNTNNAHCKYPATGTAVSPVCNPSGIGSGCTGCMYRFAHNWNTATSWLFSTQNNIGITSPDGKWAIVPWDGGLTLGCTNGATQCWSSYIANGVAKATVSTTRNLAPVVTTDASGLVTVNMANQLCLPGTYGPGNTWPASTGPIYCGPVGTPAAQITFKGFSASTEAWLNSGTMTLSAVSGCSAGICSSFTGTVPGAPLNFNGPLVEITGESDPVGCSSGASSIPCPRSDIFIIDLLSAHY